MLGADRGRTDSFKADLMSFQADAWVMSKMINARYIYHQMIAQIKALLPTDPQTANKILKGKEFSEIEGLMRKWEELKGRSFQPFSLDQPEVVATGGDDGDDGAGAAAHDNVKDSGKKRPNPSSRRTNLPAALDTYGNTGGLELSGYGTPNPLKFPGLPTFVALKERSLLYERQRKEIDAIKKKAESDNIEAKEDRLRHLEVERQVQEAIQKTATDRRKTVSSPRRRG